MKQMTFKRILLRCLWVTGLISLLYFLFALFLLTDTMPALIMYLFLPYILVAMAFGFGGGSTSAFLGVVLVMFLILWLLLLIFSVLVWSLVYIIRQRR
jgi:hypothetical protein